MSELVEHHGFHAIKLHPGTHAYYPEHSVDWLRPIMTRAGSLGIPVIVHTGDPPFSQPVQIAPLAASFPKVPVVLAHLGTQQTSYAHQAIYVARHNTNVHLEAGWGILPRLKDAVTALGPSRIMHASDCPVQEIGSQLRLLDVLGWDPPFGLSLASNDIEDLVGNNAKRLFGLG